MSFSGILKSIFSGSNIMKDLRDLADEFFTSDEERQAFELKMEYLVQKRLSEVEQTVRMEMDARSKIIIAEMQQGDKFTKRARPSLIYFGLFIIFWNYCLVPSSFFLFGASPTTELQLFELPIEFWAAWGGVVGIWSGGRTLERIGYKNKPLSLITGSPLSSESTPTAQG